MSTSLSTKVLSKSKYYICIHVALKNLEPHVPKFHTIHTFGQLKSHATIFFSGHMTRTLPSFFKDAMSYNSANWGKIRNHTRAMHAVFTFCEWFDNFIYCIRIFSVNIKMPAIFPLSKTSFSFYRHLFDNNNSKFTFGHRVGASQVNKSAEELADAES